MTEKTKTIRTTVDPWLESEDDEVVEYVVQGEYATRQAIAARGSDDLGGAIEETIHRMAGSGASEDEIYAVTGALPDEETDPDAGPIPIDLGLSLPSAPIVTGRRSPMGATLARGIDDSTGRTFCLRAFGAEKVAWASGVDAEDAPPLGESPDEWARAAGARRWTVGTKEEFADWLTS